MTDEALINRLYDIVDEITRIGGEQERTSITPGILVANANPSDLPTGYIKIVNPRDGTYVPCLTISGLVVSDNDLVNVLFTKGTEPIALSQSSSSPSNTLKVSELWASDFTSISVATDASDNVTLNTGALTLPSDIIHLSDTDTKISFTDDDIEFTAGSLSMLKLTEAGQDLITLGPGSGDVDIDFNGDMFLEGSTGHLGINTTTLTFVDGGVNVDGLLLIERPDAGALRGAVFSSISDNALRTAQNQFNKARVGPAAVADNDRIGDFYWAGHDGTDYNRSARFGAIIDGAVAANTVPMAIGFSTSATGIGGLTERMRVTPGGNVGIGETSPLAQLHVDQSDASSTEPALLLDQADVDEPFTKYVGSAAAATLTRSIVAEADVTTATRQGFVKIEIEDIGNQVTDQDYFVAFYTLA